MDSLGPAIDRSVWFARRISERTDEALRDVIDSATAELSFQPINHFLISPGAWEHVVASSIEPTRVFAHPELLVLHPETSAYYRNMALLPMKRVADLATNVKSWEDGTRRTTVDTETATSVARLYNAVISSIVEGSTAWTLDDGYRNIVASMGVGLDGTMRNLIGRDADSQVKTRITRWLTAHGLVDVTGPDPNRAVLRDGTEMVYGSEPDIGFVRNGDFVATIEIKGGRDPAGALERLGAARKSFEATPPGCANFLVAGVITAEMQRRLDSMGNVKTFALDDVIEDRPGWYAFLDEVFHHTIRIVDKRIESPN